MRGFVYDNLCSLKPSDIDLTSNNILIYGKGAKERILQIGNPDILSLSERLLKGIMKDIKKCPKSNMFMHPHNTYIQFFFTPCISFSIKRIILPFMFSLHYWLKWNDTS